MSYRTFLSAAAIIVSGHVIEDSNDGKGVLT